MPNTAWPFATLANQLDFRGLFGGVAAAALKEVTIRTCRKGLSGHLSIRELPNLPFWAVFCVKSLRAIIIAATKAVRRTHVSRNKPRV